jgi:hypothetical protein
VQFVKPLVSGLWTLVVTTQTVVVGHHSDPVSQPSTTTFYNVAPGSVLVLNPTFNFTLTMATDGALELSMPAGQGPFDDIYCTISIRCNRAVTYASYSSAGAFFTASSKADHYVAGDYIGATIHVTAPASNAVSESFTPVWMLTEAPTLSLAARVVKTYDHSAAPPAMTSSDYFVPVAFIDPDTGATVPTDVSMSYGAGTSAPSTGSQLILLADGTSSAGKALLNWGWPHADGNNPGGFYVLSRADFVGEGSFLLTANFDSGAYGGASGVVFSFPYTVGFSVRKDPTEFWTGLQNAETALLSIDKPAAVEITEALPAEPAQAYSKYCPPPPPTAAPHAPAPAPGGAGVVCIPVPIYGDCSASTGGPTEGGGTCIVGYRILCTRPDGTTFYGDGT